MYIIAFSTMTIIRSLNYYDTKLGDWLKFLFNRSTIYLRPDRLCVR